MFTNISWSTYSMVMLVLLCGWYLFVGVKYYHEEIKSILTGRSLQPENLPVTAKSVHFNFGTETNNETLTSAFADSDPTFQDVDNLVARLKTVIGETSIGNLGKAELKNYLLMVLSEYPTVKNSPFQLSVSEFIVSEFEKTGSVLLSLQEAEELWNE